MPWEIMVTSLRPVAEAISRSIASMSAASLRFSRGVLDGVAMHSYTPTARQFMTTLGAAQVDMGVDDPAKSKAQPL